MPTLSVQGAQSFELAPGAPLLELDDLAPGVIPFGCRAAACGSCVIRVLSGAGGLSAMREPERHALEIFGVVDPVCRLACQCKISADVEITREEL